MPLDDSQAEERVSQLSGLVPEFWHDLIARVVPGSVILFLTLAGGENFQRLSPDSIGGAVGILILSYTVGFLADVLTLFIAIAVGLLLHSLVRFFCFLVLKIKSMVSYKDTTTGTAAASTAQVRLLRMFTRSLTIQNYDELVDSLDPPYRNLIVKMFAEVVLCRVLFFCSFFFLLAALWPKSGFHVSDFAMKAFPIHGHDWQILVVTTPALYVAWCLINDAALERHKSVKKAQERRRTAGRQVPAARPFFHLQLPSVQRRNRIRTRK